VAGSVVTSTASVSTGDTLTLRVADGDIAATAN
jgi:exonuclease VII large subunit